MVRILTTKDLSFVKPYNSRRYPGCKEIALSFMADIQLFQDRDEHGTKRISPTIDVDKLRAHVKRLSVKEPSAYVFFGGDATDVMSPSNRAAYTGAPFYNSVKARMQDAILDDVETLYSILEPLKGRGLGFITGHHNSPPFDQDAPADYRGKTSDEVLAEKLGWPYLGDGMAVLHIPIGNVVATVLAIHPDGWGVSPGAPLNKLRRDFFPHHVADVYAIAHFHRKASEADPVLTYPESGGIKARTPKLVSMGSYCKSYVEGQTTYAEKRGYAPTALGSPVLYIRDDHGRLDIDVE
jgi:hypothetical protein